jgi:hypothetical protein
MKILSAITLLTLFVTVTAGRALTADVTEAELMQAAIELGRQYANPILRHSPHCKWRVA